jgi:hypothetical protein
MHYPDSAAPCLTCFPLLLSPVLFHHQSGDPIDEAELEAAANAMGYGAVKYADLKNSRLTNYKFSFDAMLELKGNTAVYLLYAHARIAGIVRKSGKDVDALVAGGTPFVLEHARERELAMAIVQVRGQEEGGGAVQQGLGCSAWSRGAANLLDSCRYFANAVVEHMSILRQQCI